LDVGTAQIGFSNYNNAWGVITLSGKITSTKSASNLTDSGFVVITSSTTVISTADIANAYTGTNNAVALYVSNGDLTISSGSVLSKSSYAIYIPSDGGTVTINGGIITATGTGSYAVYKSGGTVTVGQGATINGSTYGY